MKNIILPTMFAVLVLGEAAAQYSGREFIQGSASVSLNTLSAKQSDVSTLTGGLSATISKGKFLTDEKATGFSLSGGLSFYDYKNYTIAPLTKEERMSGIEGFSVGVGKFWQYYKHIGEQWGIYGEPSVNLGFSYARNFEGQSGDTYIRTDGYTYRLGLSLKAGAYYRLSEKWWLNASIGFSNPVNLSFEHNTRKSFRAGEDQPISPGSRDKAFKYEIFPVLRLPSVGLGLTYFIR